MTKTFGASLKPEKPILQWDNIVNGLGIRINLDGSRKYICKICHNNEQQWLTIGPVDSFELDCVRNTVERMKMFACTGGDPREVLSAFIRGTLLPEEHGTSFGAFAKIYIEKYAKVHKKSWLKDKQRIDLHLIPRWKDRPLASITRLEVLNVHASIGKTAPVAANRLLETIGVLFKQAILMGYLPERQMSITAGIKRFTERERERFLTKEEKAKLLCALESTNDDPWQAAALRLDFELGFRCGEIISLKWEYIDLDRGVIVLPTTKAGRSFTQPLTGAAHEILSRLPRHNQWVFPSKLKPRHHIARLDKFFKRLCREAGVKDLRLHDIRRSVGYSILEQTGSLEMVAAVLNHSSLQTTRVYAKYQKESVGMALEVHSKTLKQKNELTVDTDVKTSH